MNGKHRFWLSLLIVLLTACTATSANGDVDTNPPARMMRGVNLSGAEFGVEPARPYPGVYGTDYIYPGEASLSYFAAKGFDVVRMPFRWERLQPALFGAFIAAELSRIKEFIALAHSHGLQVIVDPHNYGRHCDVWEQGSSPYCGEHRLIGTDAVPNAAFADFWRRLASELTDQPGVYAFALMNEPTYLTPESFGMWPLAAQAALSAIRQVDAETLVLVPGNAWSGAWRWAEVNPELEDVQDPADNMMFEAHQYFDEDYSGSYSGGFEGRSSLTVSEMLAPFTAWLAENDARGFLGEYGVPRDDPRWLPVLEEFLDELDRHCIGGTAWSAGPWWGDYPLSLEPEGGVDRPQMAVLEQHLGAECARR